MNLINLITIYIFLSMALSWELTIYISDTDGVAANDYLTLGVCESCHDGFHYGEDIYDIPTFGGQYTDIQFSNLNWLGSIDSNNNQCESPEFSQDKKSIHPPSDLLQWKIRGSVEGHNSNLLLSWEMEDLSEDYEVFLYIGNISYNMRVIDSIELSSNDLYTTENDEWIDLNGDGTIQSGEWFSYDNIKVLIGGCASTGTESYYIDEDQDGWGTGLEYNFCPGLEPEGYVSNNLDLDDSYNCLTNIFDDCGICNGSNDNMDCFGTCFGDATLDDCGICNGNNDNMDCFGTCFGDATLDDCGICNGSNQSCLDLIFEHTAYNLYALIENSSILLSWEFDGNIESTFIEGFKIYYGEEDLINIGITQDLFFETTEFDMGYFCISAFDRFENESEIICSEASEYSSFSYTLHEGANLLSFPYIPQDNSPDNIFYSIRNELDGIIGEGIAAYYEEPLDSFIGSMNAIYHDKGYWVKIKLDSVSNINFNISGIPHQGDITHELHEGYNLISYLGPNNLAIDQAIPSEFLNDIISIIGEGTASTYIQNQWIGNLDYLEYGTGYWIKSNNNNILFYWNSP